MCNLKNTFGGIYEGKRILITGHTGFKGSWLTEWLLALGAEVTGLSLPPLPSPSLFDQLELGRRLGERHRIGDIRNIDVVRKAVAVARPDFVFHLAAQPLVRLSYREPVETFDTNIMGTAHVLDAVRQAAADGQYTFEKPCTVVAITTDKCYENKEWLHSYREEDPMGGHDPYSASKGAAEIVISAYRRSFFARDNSAVRLASARAGNVIGGGDWAADRIVPDCIRALQNGVVIPVRNKVATRPWQHVLEPLSGYLWLAAALSGQCAPLFPFAAMHYTNAFNFGPALASNRTVADLVIEILKHWPGDWQDRSDPNAPHEASLLNLATDKAHHSLAWSPAWDFAETIARTVAWYRDQRMVASTAMMTLSQLIDYTQAARNRGIAWACPAAA